MEPSMGDVIHKPVAILDTPEGRRYATEISGVIVHGDKPITAETRPVIEQIIAAARKHLAANPE
jgi:hypothetical protein